MLTMTQQLAQRSTVTPLHASFDDQSWPATECMMKELTPGWLQHAGMETFAEELMTLGSLEDKPERLRALSMLARATLTTDLAALGIVSTLIDRRSPDTRARIVTSLGHLAATAWTRVEGPVRQALAKASEEQHLALSMVHATQEELAQRQSNRAYAGWITNEPDGLAGHAWSVALRVAGERLWDRNWAKVSDLGNIPTRLGGSSAVPGAYQPGILRLKQASRAARTAAVDSLLHAAIQNDPDLRVCAWDNALEAAHRAPGAQPWSADVDATRAGVGEAAWAAANQSARATVQVVVNELPYVVGRIAMLALAAEACGAAARVIAIRAAADDMTDLDDTENAERAAYESIRTVMVGLSA